jgi:uncharacterized protein YbjT (DUF2867 family)
MTIVALGNNITDNKNIDLNSEPYTYARVRTLVHLRHRQTVSMVIGGGDTTSHDWYMAWLRATEALLSSSSHVALSTFLIL